MVTSKNAPKNSPWIGVAQGATKATLPVMPPITASADVWLAYRASLLLIQPVTDDVRERLRDVRLICWHKRERRG